MFQLGIFALFITTAFNQDFNSQTKLEILYPQSLKKEIDTSKLNLKIYNQGIVPYNKVIKGFLQLDFAKDGNNFPKSSYQGQIFIGNDTTREAKEKLFQLDEANIDLDLLLVVGDDKSLDKMYKGSVQYKTPILQIDQTEGQKLYQKIYEMSQNGKFPHVQIEVTFPKLQEAKEIYFDFWVPANDDFAYKNIHKMFNKFKEFEVDKSMQINYLYFEDPTAKQNNFNETLKNCVSNGRYCLYPQDYQSDITSCYIEESLRQYYIQKYYQLSFNDYLETYYTECIYLNSEQIDDCSRQQQDQIGIDSKKIDKLVKYSYVTNEDPSSDNFILGASMSEAQTQGFILNEDYSPIVKYNGQILRGNWQPNQPIVDLVCETLTEKPPQCKGHPHHHRKGHSYVILIIFIILLMVGLSYYCYRRNQKSLPQDYYNIQNSKYQQQQP